jgi:hypothetical protein
MFKSFRNLSIIFVTLMTMAFSPCAFAQDASDDIWQDSMSDLTLVGAMGLGGAILGLSTLSFVDEPKDHLKNILIGGAFGIIIGVGFVAWQQATKSQGKYEGTAFVPTADFGTTQRVAWQQAQIQKSFKKDAKSTPTFSYSFDF